MANAKYLTGLAEPLAGREEEKVKEKLLNKQTSGALEGV